MGITNELFQCERDENADCQFATHAERRDRTSTGRRRRDTISAIEKFAFFMRFLAPPTASTTRAGRQRFDRSTAASCSQSVGCAQCHTPTLRDRHFDGRGAEQQGRQSVLRPRAARDGAGSGRQRSAGRRTGRRVPDRAAVGAGSAHLLPARRPHVGPAGRRSRPIAAAAIRSSVRPKRIRASNQLNSLGARQQAGRAELPALAVRTTRWFSRGHSACQRDFFPPRVVPYAPSTTIRRGGLHADRA